VLLLPALVLMPATDTATMILVDLPLCMATTGSLATFYMLAESAQGRSRAGRPRACPCSSRSAPASRRTSRRVWEGLNNMAGEFVRTPKQGNEGWAATRPPPTPLFETGDLALSFGSSSPRCDTGHYFATPVRGALHASATATWPCSSPGAESADLVDLVFETMKETHGPRREDQDLRLR
jgi:hypothetical protein